MGGVGRVVVGVWSGWFWLLFNSARWTLPVHSVVWEGDRVGVWTAHSDPQVPT